MQFDFKGLLIEHEKDLVRLVKEINSDIEFENITKSKKDKEELLDLDYVIKRYKKIRYRIEKKEFREKNDCKYCYYYENKMCKAVRKCPIEEEEKRFTRRKPHKPRCPKDKEGNCPYGNDVGTCFGFCWKEILAEHNQAKKKREQKRKEQRYDK